MKKIRINQNSLIVIASISVLILLVVSAQVSLFSTDNAPVDRPSSSSSIRSRLKDSVVVVNVTERPPHMFFCDRIHFGGFPVYSQLFAQIFPEYKWLDMEKEYTAEQERRISNRRRRNKKKKDPIVHYRPHSEPYDIVLHHYDQTMCSPLVFRFMWQFYHGKTIFVYPEGHDTTRPIIRPGQFIDMGPLHSRDGGDDLPLTFLQVCFWSNLSEETRAGFLYGDRRRRSQNNTQKHYLIYANSNCIPFREDAFLRLSTIAESHYGGKCHGKVGTIEIDEQQHKISERENDVKLGNFHDNIHIFSEYKFCLVMEHQSSDGYITEKILNAFLGGCIPIYYGTKQIFQIFNSKAFVFYEPEDNNNLDQIRKLQKNPDLYDRMLREPIFAEGNETIRKYFSFSDSYGDGYLRKKIRSRVGLDRIRFVS